MKSSKAIKKSLLAVALFAPFSLFASQGFCQSNQTLFFPHAQFKIPFNVEPTGSQPKQVQLWVSTDEGGSWQLQGTSPADRRNFEFRAAAEGLYLFSVQTVDSSGGAHPSPQPPLRVFVDTTKPQATVKADINARGQVLVDLQISEEHLKSDSVDLRYRSDSETEWHTVKVTDLVRAGQVYEAELTLTVPPARELVFALVVADEAGNVGEATYQLAMPRTASAPADVKLASQQQTSRQGQHPTSPFSGPQAPVAAAPSAKPSPAVQTLQPTPGAVEWRQDGTQAVANKTQVAQPRHDGSVGQLAGSGGLSLDPSSGNSGNSGVVVEELPSPRPIESESAGLPVAKNEAALQGLPASPESKPSDVDKVGNKEATDSSPFGRAFNCNSRAFSLDYSVDALGGSTLANIELWGTEDGGRTWEKWGADPDRQSPFDVQVNNDGLFGFRMVVVSANGIVSNRPKDGDSADAWINVDTELPNVKITRAVYGEGAEAGMLVIDYTCNDANLLDKPINLSYSETLNGPWTTITTAVKNSGIYLWKAGPALPENIFLRIEAVDKSGNLGEHRLDLPISTQGLTPRGRIQGFHPIRNP